MKLSARDFGHVYWLGGGSGAGKSTIARRLATEHNLQLYDTDLAMRDHGDRCPPSECPRLQEFKDMTMDERWVERSPEEMLETFHWFNGEGFHLILEDLMSLKNGQRVIADGFRLLPALVKPFLTSVSQAVWLIPTPEFRAAAIKCRGTVWDIPNKTSQPMRALDNLWTRDALFTERLLRETKVLGLPTISVDVGHSENQSYRNVEEHFVL
ncbi:MAG: hypothetical protein AAGA73_07630 [Pseudomonadota bacterium]